MLEWSAAYPGADSAKQQLQKTLSTQSGDLKGFTLDSVTVDGDKATVLATAEMIGVDSKTGKVKGATDRMNRVFHLVREKDASWKIVDYKGAEEELAAEIAASKTDSERKALLEAHKDLFGVKLDRALIAEGVHLAMRAAFTEARAIFELVQGLAMKVNDRSGLAAALQDAGNIDSNQGRYHQAMEGYLKSLSIREEIGDKSAIARSLWSIGSAYDDQGDYSNALDYYQKSLNTLRETGDEAAVAGLLANIGIVEWHQGDYSAALQNEEKSFEISEKLGDRMLAGKTLMNLGIIQAVRGNYLQA
ncbi:MAG: tetratricopeptide repeat protein, partial [Blastocatellia bacterium]